MKKKLLKSFVVAGVMMMLPMSAMDAKAASVEIADAFPDEVFSEYVSTEFDKDKDGSLSQDELDAVAEIDVYGLEIKSLKGIKYFTNLTYLDCSYTNISSLDVSSNTKLESLYCYFVDIDELDVSKNVELHTLSFPGATFTTIDLSNNTKLWFLACSNTSLTKLNLSKNTALQSLYCAGVETLKTLDLTNNKNLIVVNIVESTIGSVYLPDTTTFTTFYRGESSVTVYYPEGNDSIEAMIDASSTNEFPYYTGSEYENVKWVVVASSSTEEEEVVEEKEETVVEETVEKEEAVVEETVVEETVEKEETVVEETVEKEETVVEETVEKEETVVEETVEKEETVVEETIEKEEIVEEEIIEDEIVVAITEALDSEDNVVTLEAEENKVVFTEEAITLLVGNDAVEAAVISGGAQIVFDYASLVEIDGQAAGVTLTVEAGDVMSYSDEVQELIGDRPIYDLTLSDDEGNLTTDFGDGMVTVTFTYELGEDESADYLAIYYLWFLDDGTSSYEIMDDYIYDSEAGAITFTTSHFSTFAVGYDDAAADTTSDEVEAEDTTLEDDTEDVDTTLEEDTEEVTEVAEVAETNSNVILYVIIAIIVGALVVVFVRRKRVA